METASAGTFQEACARIESDKPYDLILLDYNMPSMNGPEGLSKAIALKDAQRVALISGEATRQIAQDALAADSAGFVPKSLPAKSLVNAIKFMATGEQYAPIYLMTAVEEVSTNALAEKLTPRELQVLKGLTEGKSNKEIAGYLDITEPKIKLHVKTIYCKVGQPTGPKLP